MQEIKENIKPNTNNLQNNENYNPNNENQLLQPIYPKNRKKRKFDPTTMAEPDSERNKKRYKNMIIATPNHSNKSMTNLKIRLSSTPSNSVHRQKRKSDIFFANHNINNMDIENKAIINPQKGDTHNITNINNNSNNVLGSISKQIKNQKNIVNNNNNNNNNSNINQKQNLYIKQQKREQPAQLQQQQQYPFYSENNGSVPPLTPQSNFFKSSQQFDSPCIGNPSLSLSSASNTPNSNQKNLFLLKNNNNNNNNSSNINNNVNNNINYYKNEQMTRNNTISSSASVFQSLKKKDYNNNNNNNMSSNYETLHHTLSSTISNTPQNTHQTSINNNNIGNLTSPMMNGLGASMSKSAQRMKRRRSSFIGLGFTNTLSNFGNHFMKQQQTNEINDNTDIIIGPGFCFICVFVCVFFCFLSCVLKFSQTSSQFVSLFFFVVKTQF